MKTLARTGGGRGTNQYRRQGSSSAGVEPRLSHSQSWKYWPPEQWSAVVRDLPEEDRLEMARHPACPPNLLARLSRDPYWIVHYAVAENANTPKSTLRRLGTRDDPYVMENLARNVNCPRDIQLKLTSSHRKTVQGALAGNPNCDPAALVLLAESGVDQDVAYTSLRHPRLPLSHMTTIARLGPGWQRSTILRRPDLPATVVAEMVQDSNPEIRHMAAKHPNCPAAALEQLLRDKELFVRQAAADHPDLSPATRAMWQLAQ